jgi:ATP-dependent Lon protease
MPVKKKVAMTGEITLMGRVMAIGGLKEKVLAAYREGITTVLFPEANKKDLADIPKDVLNKVNMMPVANMDDVMAIVFDRKKGGVKK